MNNLDDLAGLFYGKQQLPPGAYDLGNTTHNYLSAMAVKAQQCDISLEKFKALDGYK
jgi:hypothetical protein